MNKFLLMEEEAGGDVVPGGEGGGGEDTGNWYDGFAEDVRTNNNITKFGSAEELGKSYINAQRLIGVDKIPMPETDDDWSNVYGRLGRPDEASMYTIDAVEGFEVNEEQQTAFKEWAHGKGFSQSQLQDAATYDMERQISAAAANKEASQAKLDEATNSLKAEWGEAHAQNVNLAARAADEFMGDAGKEFFDNAMIDGVPAGEHPGLLKMFHSVAKGMMESSKLEGQGNEGKQTPQEITDSIGVEMGKPAYMDKNHPEHPALMRKVEGLFKLQAG